MGTKYQKGATALSAAGKKKGSGSTNQGTAGAVAVGVFPQQAKRKFYSDEEPNAYAQMDEAFTTFRLNGSTLPSRYEVIITPPVAAGIAPSDAANCSLRCESVSLPGKNLTTSLDTNMYGVQPMIVDGVTFAGTATMTFTASQDMRERALFEMWQDQAWNSHTWNIGYYNDYIGKVTIYLLDMQMKRTFGVDLMECYPKEINANVLSAKPATEALKLTISMQYKFWKGAGGIHKHHVPGIGDI